MEFPRHCAGPEEMRAVGRELATGLEAGMVIGLDGDLGAGKTELVKGVAAALGSSGPVTSPTFSLLHEYQGGRLPLYHLDFYRIETAVEVLDLGWDELVDDGAVIVEWAGRFPELLPVGTLRLRLEVLPDGGREVRLEGAESPG